MYKYIYIYIYIYILYKVNTMEKNTFLTYFRHNTYLC